MKSKKTQPYFIHSYLRYRALMASAFLHSLSHLNPPHQNHLSPITNPPPLIIQKSQNPQGTHFPAIKCTSNSAPEPSNNDPSFPTPASTALNSPETFPIEKRRRSEIVRERMRKTGLVKPDPPNFEVGWKRTKEIKLEKPVGWMIMDFLEKLESLMGKEFGSKELLAKAGEIVSERAREEAEVLRDEGKVEDRMVTELFRVLRLMEMDLAMVKAAVKEETLSERLEQAKARCRQAILVANAF